MNALPWTLPMEAMEGEATDSSRSKPYLPTVVSVLNRLLTDIHEPGLYEDEEPEINPRTLINAARILAQLNPEEMLRGRLSTYWGELSFTWSQNGRRVKASFIGTSFSVYDESMRDGRVIDSHLEPQGDVNYLVRKLAPFHYN